MMERFSKPSGDIAQEWDRLLREEGENLRRERLVSALLAQGAARVDCLVCGGSLAGHSPIPHRLAEYLYCRACGHFQSARIPPAEHGIRLQAEIPFHSIYRPLDAAAYRSRVERVYRPKLDWILDSAPALGLTRAGLLGKRWMEIGCGAGYFLKALQDAGATQVQGLDQDARLVEMANQALPGSPASHFAEALPEALEGRQADLYAAFYVLEHTERLRDFLAALKAKPPGTIFCFAVPMLGFGAALEAGFDHFYARNLDGAVHTQLFTDRSIARALEDAGYEAVSRWTFGQDATDLVRMAVTRLQGIYPEELLEPIRRGLTAAQDAWQAALDRSFLADSRHVLAVKR